MAILGTTPIRILLPHRARAVLIILGGSQTRGRELVRVYSKYTVRVYCISRKRLESNSSLQQLAMELEAD